MPGCSLCMGNQAQTRKGATAMSTSTRNFPNRLGIDTRVYLGSAELAAVCALLGRIPTVAEYMQHIEAVNKNAGDVYRYMNFDQIDEYRSAAAEDCGLTRELARREALMSGAEMQREVEKTEHLGKREQLAREHGERVHQWASAILCPSTPPSCGPSNMRAIRSFAVRAAAKASAALAAPSIACPGDYKLHTGLACTTLVKEGMALTQIPSVPMEKAVYDLEKLTPGRERDPAGLSGHLPLRRLRHLQQGLSARSAGDGLHPVGHARRHRRGG